jgi:hypothetical protein
MTQALLRYSGARWQDDSNDQPIVVDIQAAPHMGIRRPAPHHPDQPLSDGGHHEPLPDPLSFEFVSVGLIIAGALIIAGCVAIAAVGPFHPSRENPNDHPAVFAEYAASTSWIGVHYAQFAAVLTLLAGFVVLDRALTLARSASALDHVAFGAVITTAAALTVPQAVDGVALKHAVDAWAAATGPEKAARFGDAEVVRWIEWGANSYFYTMLGVTPGLFGLAMLRSSLPKWLGWVAMAGGLAFVATALPVGYCGFQTSPAGMVAMVGLAATPIGITIAGIPARAVPGPDAVRPTGERALQTQR